MPNVLKSYPPTWEGELLLACRKCQKKLKGQPGMRALAKLKKTIKRRNKEHPNAALHLVSVPCLNLCPKRAVTVCLPAKRDVMVSVLRNEADVDKLFRGDVIAPQSAPASVQGQMATALSNQMNERV